MRAALIALLAVSCTTEHGSSPPRSLCDVCTVDSECPSGVCRMYGDGFRKCTTSCAPGEPAMQCTDPASGACNGMGFCMCPFVSVPTDGGPAPIDAPTSPAHGASTPDGEGE